MSIIFKLKSSINRNNLNLILIYSKDTYGWLVLIEQHVLAWT